jgi:hypothetical protein
MHDLKSRALHGKRAALHLEAPATSSYSDWLLAAIHHTGQDLLELRFVGFPPRDDSRFSSAVRRRPGQLMLELGCDGVVEQMFWARPGPIRYEQPRCSNISVRLTVPNDGDFLWRLTRFKRDV